jgi:hypothetical protein
MSSANNFGKQFDSSVQAVLHDSRISAARRPVYDGVALSVPPEKMSHHPGVTQLTLFGAV